MLNLDSSIDSDADLLIKNVDVKYKPVFEKANYSDEKKRAIYRYFFSRKPQKLPPSLKNRVVNLYDPLANRTKRFPDGLRYCVNVYVGCEHACSYCYVNGYSRNSVSHSPHVKSRFTETLVKDLNDLKSLRLPEVPLHMSNSTDILQQKLESTYGHSLFALQKIMGNRDLFSSIVLLTKNPSILCQPEYLNLLKQLSIRPLTVQITCAYWRDEVRLFYEPEAPEIEKRLKALKVLCANGINVELRIDPLFPASYLNENVRKHAPLSAYSLPEIQTISDLTNLIRYSKEAGVTAVIAKPLKIPISNTAKQAKDLFGQLYSDSYPNGKREARGSSWRLPEHYQKAIMSTLGKICNDEGLSFRYCKHDLLQRR